MFDKSFEVLDLMKEEFVKPGIIVFTCLVQTCVKTKNMPKLVEIYEELKKAKVVGDPVFYNTLISGMMFNHYIRSALEVTIDTL
mmetsp:Transcript_11330/g.1764  ORF Transcript_11330/g.1764 Transcript_11330/m.1764 type:complete len:84 (+) Transcript_11330:658-909(+)